MTLFKLQIQNLFSFAFYNQCIDADVFCALVKVVLLYLF